MEQTTQQKITALTNAFNVRDTQYDKEIERLQNQLIKEQASKEKAAQDFAQKIETLQD